MFFRTRRSHITLFGLLTSFASLGYAESDPGHGDNLEAETLFSRANDYVSHITENDYSYAYIQFYWKRAQSNIDRIIRVYPQTPMGQQVSSNQVKLGPYDLTYFKERVLPHLEVKKLAAFDAVNCAISLYNPDEISWNTERQDTFVAIVELLSAQKRWSEALRFPADQHSDLLFTTIFRVAARFQYKNIINELLSQAQPEQEKLLWPILGEAMALNGSSREEINRFVDAHPESTVKAAILSGMVDHELGIHLVTTRKDQVKRIEKAHFWITNLDVRYDVDSINRAFFPSSTSEADQLVEKYHAGLGTKPSSSANVSSHLAHLEFLAAAGKFDELSGYTSATDLAVGTREQCDLKTLELLAENGRDCSSLRATYLNKEQRLSEAAARAEFYGQIRSRVAPFVVRERTFADLKIKNPYILAQILCEWSLTPEHTMRGAAPWDAVVRKFQPGFENLPEPKSKEVQDAASQTKLF